MKSIILQDMKNKKKMMIDINSNTKSESESDFEEIGIYVDPFGNKLDIETCEYC